MNLRRQVEIKLFAGAIIVAERFNKRPDRAVIRDLLLQVKFLEVVIEDPFERLGAAEPGVFLAERRVTQLLRLLPFPDALRDFAQLRRVDATEEFRSHARSFSV